MIKKTIPCMFTLGNLAFGLLSIIMSFQHNYRMASIFVLIAAFTDRYDGRIARYLGVSSDIGKELDSLADLVSFGVAPAILSYVMYDFSSIGILGYIPTLLFPLAGAYRLARFNCSQLKNIFIGVPITFAGAFIAIFTLIFINNPEYIAFPIILMVALSYLMVCNIKIKKV
ncbi:CDP-diacylglycerol--serine O-phosphatidyltransferase [Clostridium oryzae]|uniref:CDP-diacylglycerol--serine O-phosphatidyltransferase n=1 Tax=Clostridium oryzae TaxID=1450648 RepID=A0A1V4IK42_9CLOT|nr:CDP-diacylglycerol--serine O-phosphatidyltransferase [Clostridium oryzae]OPJ60115.1 CDP-alcohol phosphatidyltransferase [Clostridium oryzae]